jgi:C-terminal processing protease CtpA/Prc
MNIPGKGNLVRRRPVSVRPRFHRPSPNYTEKNYSEPYPRRDLRLLAAARIWGVFHYFHPYQYLYGEDWDAVLATILPRMASAKNAHEYYLAVAEMVAHTNDSHCSVRSQEFYKTFGRGPSPVEVRWIENQPVVTRVVNTGLANSIHPGDVVTEINFDPVEKRIAEISAATSASTPPALHEIVMTMLLWTTPGFAPTITVRGADGASHDVSIRNAPGEARSPLPPRGGDIYRLLAPRIGYVDLDRLTPDQVDAMFTALKDTDAIILDMRGIRITPPSTSRPGWRNLREWWLRRSAPTWLAPISKAMCRARSSNSIFL